MSAIPSRTNRSPLRMNKDVTALIPDFPFHYADFLQKALDNQGSPLGHVAPENYGKQVLIVGAGVAGLVAAYEAMRMGLHPVVVEASERIGGRLYSKVQGDPENPGDQVLCELGAMRFPVSGKALFHYFRKVGMSENSADFPNPGTAAAISTVVDYRGEKPITKWTATRTFQNHRNTPTWKTSSSITSWKPTISPPWKRP